MSEDSRGLLVLRDDPAAQLEICRVKAVATRPVLPERGVTPAGNGIERGPGSNTVPPEPEFRTVEARKKPPRSEAACGVGRSNLRPAG